MNPQPRDFYAYAFSRKPGYDETETRKAFAQAVPLRTVVIYCYDPRATRIPAIVAKEFGETFPGDIITGDKGKRVASTATLFEVVVAGGRAVDALRSVTVAQHLFGIENIVVVHHTHCGATSFTPDGIIEAFKHEHGADIADLYPRDSIAIHDYESSLKHDTRLLRESEGTPKHVNIFGFLFDIDTNELIPVVEDYPAARKEIGLSA